MRLSDDPRLEGLWKDLKNPTDDELKDIISTVPYLREKAAKKLLKQNPSFVNCVFIIADVSDVADGAFRTIVESSPTKEELIEAIGLYREKSCMDGDRLDLLKAAYTLLLSLDLSKEELMEVINSLGFSSSMGCICDQYVDAYLKLKSRPTNTELRSLYRIASRTRPNVGCKILGHRPSEDDLMFLILDHYTEFRPEAWDKLKAMGPSKKSLREILTSVRALAYEAAELWLTMDPDRNDLLHMVTYIDNGSLESSPLHVRVCEMMMEQYPDEHTFPHVMFYAKSAELKARAARGWLKLKRGNAARNEVRSVVVRNCFAFPVAVEFARDILVHKPTKEDLLLLIEYSRNASVVRQARRRLQGRGKRSNKDIIAVMAQQDAY